MHAMTTHAGLGANTAFQDAADLAVALKAQDWRSGLTKYENAAVKRGNGGGRVCYMCSVHVVYTSVCVELLVLIITTDFSVLCLIIFLNTKQFGDAYVGVLKLTGSFLGFKAVDTSLTSSMRITSTSVVGAALRNVVMRAIGIFMH